MARISYDKIVGKIWDLRTKTTNNISFHYRTNSVKINDQFFQQIKKKLILADFGTFSQFLGENFFSNKSDFVKHNLNMGF